MDQINQTLSYIQPFLPLIQEYGPNLVGVVLPPIIQILAKDIPKDAQVSLNIAGVTFNLEKRFIASLTVCGLAALILKGDTLSTGSPEQLKNSFVAIFFESQVVYRMYFKDSFWSQKITQKLTPTSSGSLASLGAEG